MWPFQEVSVSGGVGAVAGEVQSPARWFLGESDPVQGHKPDTRPYIVSGTQQEALPSVFHGLAKSLKFDGTRGFAWEDTHSWPWSNSPSPALILFLLQLCVILLQTPPTSEPQLTLGSAGLENYCHQLPLGGQMRRKKNKRNSSQNQWIHNLVDITVPNATIKMKPENSGKADRRAEAPKKRGKLVCKRWSNETARHQDTRGNPGEAGHLLPQVASTRRGELAWEYETQHGAAGPRSPGDLGKWLPGLVFISPATKLRVGYENTFHPTPFLYLCSFVLTTHRAGSAFRSVPTSAWLLCPDPLFFSLSL